MAAGIAGRMAERVGSAFGGKILATITKHAGVFPSLESEGVGRISSMLCSTGKRISALQHPYFKNFGQNPLLLDVFHTPRLSIEWMDKDIAKLIEFGPISAAPIKKVLSFSEGFGDFGLARTFDGAPSENSEVGTLAYKAPELILEMRQTTTAADIWPVGCIFAEMVNGTPPFDTKIDVYLMRNIISILGVPTETEWPRVTSALREFCASGALQHPYFMTLLQNAQLLDVFYTPRLSFEWMDKDIAKLIEFGPISASRIKSLLLQILRGFYCHSHEVGTLAYIAPELILGMQQTAIAAHIYVMRGLIISVVPTEIEGPEVALCEFCAPNKILLAAFPKYADGFSCLESDLISKMICFVSGESIFSSRSSAASILQSLAESTHILFKKLQIVFHGHSRYFASRSGKRGRRGGRGSKTGKSKKGGGGGPKQKSKEKKNKVGKFPCYPCKRNGRKKHLFNSEEALTKHKKVCPSVKLPKHAKRSKKKRH